MMIITRCHNASSYHNDDHSPRDNKPSRGYDDGDILWMTTETKELCVLVVVDYDDDDDNDYDDDDDADDCDDNVTLWRRGCLE